MSTPQSLNLLVLPGDGIGPEVVAEGLKVLRAFCQRFNITLTLTEGDLGGVAVDRHGVPFPDSTRQAALAADAVLLGAVGGPKYDTLPPHLRPEQGLLQIRKAMGLYANLRPVKLFAPLLGASSLKPEVLEGVDLLVVRELTGGLYFGTPKEQHADWAVDTMTYTRAEIERIARLGFELAQARPARNGKKTLCSVDKANVLATSRLWREVVEGLAPSYPEVTVEHQYVDNAAMQLLLRPAQYNVLLTENTFGDILSDEASMLTGSLGMLASASLGQDEHGNSKALYEPSHGSAPDIAGQNKANPIATILSVKLLIETTLGMPQQAALIDEAIELVLEAGTRTADIAGAGCNIVSTTEMGDLIAQHLLKPVMV